MVDTVAGGFAFVFMAQDPNTGKDYALKVSDEIHKKNNWYSNTEHSNIM